MSTDHKTKQYRKFVAILRLFNKWGFQLSEACRIQSVSLNGRYAVYFLYVWDWQSKSYTMYIIHWYTYVYIGCNRSVFQIKSFFSFIQCLWLFIFFKKCYANALKFYEKKYINKFSFNIFYLRQYLRFFFHGN